MTKKNTFANEGVKPRNILTKKISVKLQEKDRKPLGEKLGKNPLKTYVNDAELEAIKVKAGGIPLATYLRNFLREKGFFE